MSKRKDESREGEKVVGKGIPGSEMPDPGALAAASRGEQTPAPQTEDQSQVEATSGNLQVLPDQQGPAGLDLPGITTGPVDTYGVYDVEEAVNPTIPPELFSLHSREAARVILDALMHAPALKVAGNPTNSRKLQARYLAQMAGALQGAVARL